MIYRKYLHYLPTLPSMELEPSNPSVALCIFLGVYRCGGFGRAVEDFEKKRLMIFIPRNSSKNFFKNLKSLFCFISEHFSGLSLILSTRNVICLSTFFHDGCMIGPCSSSVAKHLKSFQPYVIVSVC